MSVYKTTDKIFDLVRLYKIYEKKQNHSLCMDDLIILGWIKYNELKNRDININEEIKSLDIDSKVNK